MNNETRKDRLDLWDTAPSGLRNIQQRCKAVDRSLAPT